MVGSVRVAIGVTSILVICRGFAFHDAAQRPAAGLSEAFARANGELSTSGNPTLAEIGHAPWRKETSVQHPCRIT